MAPATRPVLIAGGGIGGLTAAIALARTRTHSHVLERSAFAEESGAGIQLGPNATRILRKLGILQALMPSAFKPDGIRIFDGLGGRELTAMPLGEAAEARYGAPYLTFHRADLHAGLHTIARGLEPITLASGFGVAEVRQDNDGVAVTSVDAATVEGAGLVGADGLWSTVRASLAPQETLRFSGATAFRTMVPRAELPERFAASTVGLWLGPNAHLVHYPVRGGDALNVVAVVEGGHAARGWNERADLSVLQNGFARWCKESKSLMERAQSWRSWALFSLAPLPSWGRGPTTLLGDAAHPVQPYLAQGAGLAIEDAETLARCLSHTPEQVATAFRAYETARCERSIRLQRTSQRFGQLYHLGGLPRLARDIALRWRRPEAALSRFDWLYRPED